jgi:hypothetical protein
MAGMDPWPLRLPGSGNLHTCHLDLDVGMVRLDCHGRVASTYLVLVSNSEFPYVNLKTATLKPDGRKLPRDIK